MWSRGQLKSQAKAVLRNNYWKAFLISLVIAFVQGGGGNSSGGGSGSGITPRNIGKNIGF